jgi:S-disulfanyl-L-cysteine oxidoreductase SoxD
MLVSWSRSATGLGVGLAAVILFAGCTDEAEVAEAERARGEELYQMHCAACHGGATGGDITDIPPPHNAEGHTWHHADCELERIVLEGMPRREGFPEMPAFGDQLSVEEVQAILAHIKTWWEPDQRQFQADVTEQVC